ncbi:MAG: DUF389 domain-containing protein [Chloroflexota bacterium]
MTFTVLLALASLIAAFGLYQDSVASIIGAMVVAPLGGAIMAFAGALVTGRSRWVAISFLQVALGALMTVAIGYAVSALLPDPLGLTPSLTARTQPNLLDLGVALAAGRAGAYVAARRTGADALPGVAIAVSLVPPLATVGICLELGRLDGAGGALLLFLTTSRPSRSSRASSSCLPMPRRRAPTSASGGSCKSASWRPSWRWWCWPSARLELDPGAAQHDPRGAGCADRAGMDRDARPHRGQLVDRRAHDLPRPPRHRGRARRRAPCRRARESRRGACGRGDHLHPIERVTGVGAP